MLKLRDRPDKEDVHSRAYLTFKDHDSLIAFHTAFNGWRFENKAHAVHLAVVEMAPYQPADTKHKGRADLVGAIFRSHDYLEFILDLDASLKVSSGDLKKDADDSNSNGAEVESHLIKYLKIVRSNTKSNSWGRPTKSELKVAKKLARAAIKAEKTDSTPKKPRNKKKKKTSAPIYKNSAPAEATSKSTYTNSVARPFVPSGPVTIQTRAYTSNSPPASPTLKSEPVKVRAPTPASWAIETKPDQKAKESTDIKPAGNAVTNSVPSSSVTAAPTVKEFKPFANSSDFIPAPSSTTSESQQNTRSRGRGSRGGYSGRGGRRVKPKATTK